VEGAFSENLAAYPAAENHATAIWKGRGKGLLVFLFLTTAYRLTFSHHFDDALDTAFWMENHSVGSLVEFRHLLYRPLPFWLWEFLRAFHVHISALRLISLWDWTTAAVSVMLLYRVLLELTEAQLISLGGAFAFATAHAVWLYAGTGRLYSTSMFLAIAGYYLAVQAGRSTTRIPRWVLAFAAGTMICFACLFWLIHVLNAVGVGLLLLTLPPRPFGRRLGYFALYSITGIALALTITASCLSYVHIPLTPHALQTWIGKTNTQPMQFDRLSLMKASYGQANGILALPDLPYMIHGILLKDASLTRLNSLSWQLSKFIFIWLLLVLVYLYPLMMLKRSAREKRILILALYIPLAANMFFALGWLGTDVQRFMPTMLSQVGLGALAAQDLLSRVPRPRLLGASLAVCLVFIAGDNLAESLLPYQRHYRVLAEETKAIRPYVRPNDLMVTFGKDFDVTYQTMLRFYGGATPLDISNDPSTYDWDRRDWKTALAKQWRETREQGGRVFVIDRLALGFKPPQAAWSERQHPYPTVQQFSSFLQAEFCVTPAFYLGDTRYFEVGPKTPSCPSERTGTRAEIRP